MRAIDADALAEILTTAIRNMQGAAKFIGAEDDPEIKMEIKAYTDILNGVKEMPTIEPERKKGKWIYEEDSIVHGYCSCCGFNAIYQHADVFGCDFCPNCGADMRGDSE